MRVLAVSALRPCDAGRNRVLKFDAIFRFQPARGVLSPTVLFSRSCSYETSTRKKLGEERERTFAAPCGQIAPEWSSARARSTFLNYFIGEHGHAFVPSSPVVPWDDRTLAFVNAGMNQFKNVFLGLSQPQHVRVVNTQKCIRVGGKHNDLNVVGKDGCHHTFFEMMGNWSFGDYTRERACFFALDLLTRVYGIPLSRLYFTYFGGDERAGLRPDEESRNLWLNLGVPAERILEFGPKENFWDMGSVGPCGPCTEIHYDHRADRSTTEAVELVNSDDPTLIELWNLVFIQYQRTPTGALQTLGKTFVDTGMGFERLVAVLNGKVSNYDTDVFQPIFHAIHSACGSQSYGGSFESALDESYRVMADHARMFTVAAADGLLPTYSQKLRNIIHRFCYRAEKSFNVAGEDIIPNVCDAVFSSLSSGFPELLRSRLPAVGVVIEEARRYRHLKNCAREQAFSVGGEEAVKDLNVEQIHNHPGLINLIEEVNRLVRMKRLKGGFIDVEEAARLCIQNDVSFEIFKKVTEFKKIEFDETSVRDKINEALADGNNDSLDNVRSVDPKRLETLQTLVKNGVMPTKDGSKYSSTYDRKNKLYRVPPINARLLFVEGGSEGAKILFVLDRSPFYAERGGQSHDGGYIRSGSGLARVDYVYSVGGTGCGDDFVVHEGVVLIGNFRTGDGVFAEVDPERRTKITLNHTGVHLLNGALRKMFKDATIAQNSSWVGPDYARFDFICGDETCKQGRNVEEDAMLKVEDLVNTVIAEDLKITRHITRWSAVSSLPNLATVPGEVYPEAGLTVIEVPDFSLEPCCGTHAARTGHLEKFVIIQNKSVRAGVRSVKFVTASAAAQVEENDTAFELKLKEVLGDLAAHDVSPETLDAVKAFDALRRARKELASVELISYRKRRQTQTFLDAQAEIVRRAAKKQIVAMMGSFLRKAVSEAEKNGLGFVACCLDFGPDFTGLEVPLAKAAKFCPGNFPSAVFAISDNHIVGRCVVPPDAVTEEFNAARWMSPVAEFLDVEFKAPKGQDAKTVVGLKSARFPANTAYEEMLIHLSAAVRLASEVYPALVGRADAREGPIS